MPKIVDGQEFWSKKEVDAFVVQAVINRLEPKLQKLEDDKQIYISHIQNLESKIVELKEKNLNLIEKLEHKKKKIKKTFKNIPGRAQRISTQIDKCIERNRAE